MNCLKCGKDAKNEQSFCKHCLEAMDAYPVKSDAHVQLPTRPAEASPKKTVGRRRSATPEEQLARLRKRARRLTAAVALLALLLCAVSGAILHNVLSQDSADLGKNYTFDNPFD